MNLDLIRHVRAALDLPETEREAFLHRACAGDARLYAQALAQVREAAALELATSDTDRAPESIASTIKAMPEALREGAVIGAFRLLRPLGSGGMGQVWLADRVDDFAQQVAIKWLHLSMSESARLRFAREREVLAKLNHPNIAHIVDGGEYQGVPWYAMEFVDGVPLDQFAQQQSLDLPARIGLMIRLCEAVQFAHQRLIVHRDLKPGNVLVQADGTPKLLDFGIAKLLDNTDSMTETRAPMTMAYAAPEQLLGDPITTATDVYALGVIFFELITGRRPFVSVQDARELPQQLTTDATTKPSAALLQSHATHLGISIRQLRGDLDTIALKALTRDPTRRYASAGALADDLKRHQSGYPIEARPDSGLYRLRKLVARHRLSATALLLAVLGVIAGLSMALVASQREATALRAASELADANAKSREFLVSLFQGAAPEQNLGKPLTAIELLDAGWTRLQQSDLQGETLSQTALSMGESFYGLGEMSKALAAYQVALKNVSDTAEVKSRVELQLKIASVQAELVQFDLARQSVRDAQSKFSSIQSPELQRKANRLLGFIERDAANYGASIAALQAALKLEPMSKPERAGLLNSLAYSQAMLGDSVAARASFDATRLELSELPAQHPSRIWLDYTEGDALRRLGRFDEAKVKLDRAHQALIGATGQGQAILRVVQMARAVLAMRAGVSLDATTLNDSGLSTTPKAKLNLIEIEAHLIYAHHLQSSGQITDGTRLQQLVRTQCQQNFSTAHPFCRG